ncbi:MAG: cupin domain-containing protein, partial [Anaerolineae bacterium]|nr:cupin domain-containing protein [Anaerolineae bacterium]
MKSILLHDNITFHDNDPYAEPLFVDETGRVLRFALKPGQIVREHTAPHSPVYIVVLQGSGLFSGGDNQEERFGPGTLLIFDTGEVHAIRAEAEELVFVAFLHGVPG